MEDRIPLLSYYDERRYLESPDDEPRGGGAARATDVEKASDEEVLDNLIISRYDYEEIQNSIRTILGDDTFDWNDALDLVRALNRGKKIGIEQRDRDVYFKLTTGMRQVLDVPILFPDDNVMEKLTFENNIVKVLKIITQASSDFIFQSGRTHIEAKNLYIVLSNYTVPIPIDFVRTIPVDPQRIPRAFTDEPPMEPPMQLPMQQPMEPPMEPPMQARLASNLYSFFFSKTAGLLLLGLLVAIIYEIEFSEKKEDFYIPQKIPLSKHLHNNFNDAITILDTKYNMKSITTSPDQQKNNLYKVLLWANMYIKNVPDKINFNVISDAPIINAVLTGNSDTSSEDASRIISYFQEAHRHSKNVSNVLKIISLAVVILFLFVTWILI